MSICLENKTVLVTGSAGFIGYFLCKKLLESFNNISVIGVDNVNDYYDVKLKEERIRLLDEMKKKFVFIKEDISNKDAIDLIFSKYKPTVVVNLAAQAGVEYSIHHPEAYIQSNIVGFFNILQACRFNKVEHLVYASSSSVYGSNKKCPNSVSDKVDNPLSLYAASKKSNELFAHCYSKLYGIPSTGLRFFSVYGPLGRPDMAMYKFTNKILKGEPIQINNNGDMYRDFTYIDDIITGVIMIMQKIPKLNEDNVPYKVYNIGNSHPEKLMDLVDYLEELLLKEGIIKEKFKKEFVPMQPADVYKTFADVSELEKEFGYKPGTPLKEGMTKFVRWYKEYYHL